MFQQIAREGYGVRLDFKALGNVRLEIIKF